MSKTLPEQIEDIIEIMRAWANGAVIEHRRYGSSKWDTVDPQWLRSGGEYRVRPATNDTVDWSLINPEYRYMARDEDQTFWFYVNEPKIDDEVYHQGWTSSGKCVSGEAMSFPINNGKPWYDSLIERPEGV